MLSAEYVMDFIERTGYGRKSTDDGPHFERTAAAYLDSVADNADEMFVDGLFDIVEVREFADRCVRKAIDEAGGL